MNIVDKRRIRENSEEIIATEPNLKPTYVQELEERTRRAEATLRQRVADLEEETQRSRDRIQAGLEQRFERKELDLLVEVLSLLDDVDRAAALSCNVPAVTEGLSLLTARVEHFLKAHGCTKFVPENQPFDPETMEAVAAVDGQAGLVASVFKPGYLKKGSLIRPAQVAVGRTTA